MGMLGKLLSKKNKEVLITRAKSFVWRSCMLLIVVALDFASQSLGLLDLNPESVVMVGLVLGEVSKYLNSEYDLESFFRTT